MTFSLTNDWSHHSISWIERPFFTGQYQHLYMFIVYIHKNSIYTFGMCLQYKVSCEEAAKGGRQWVENKGPVALLEPTGFCSILEDVKCQAPLMPIVLCEILVVIISQNAWACYDWLIPLPLTTTFLRNVSGERDTPKALSDRSLATVLKLNLWQRSLILVWC